MKRNKDPPAAIEAYQKMVDEMTEAREKKRRRPRRNKIPLHQRRRNVLRKNRVFLYIYNNTRVTYFVVMIQ